MTKPESLLAYCFIAVCVLALSMLIAIGTRPPPPYVDREIDSSIGSLVSTTITSARREGSETVLILSDGRTIVVRGYKGHHFYERKPR